MWWVTKYSFSLFSSLFLGVVKYPHVRLRCKQYYYICAQIVKGNGILLRQDLPEI